MILGKIVFLINKVFLILALLTTVSCAMKPTADPHLNRLIAQKLMLDIRYYCADAKADENCTTPVTALPPALSQMLTDTGIGGVVLFANNLENTQQMLQLNYALQQAAQRGGHSPLFIAIDQEGGRVVRIPQNLATSFAGNMAIGATYKQYGTKYAQQSGEIFAKELLALGFNVNFAPTVDVNVNPLNPVINVRSYGEDANMVAQLGTVQMAAMQSQGMMATLKHFPGHGDTSVDSHTGLPRVDHALSQIENTDLLPFQYAIDNDAPAMIMTAHIQYPQLDNSEFIAKDGSKVILPATMSRAILTDLLRNKMGFKGVIATDALNMAGIAHYFDETEAVIQTFAAGSDIALMPIAIRSPANIAKVTALINDVAKAVRSGRLSRQEFERSAQRINHLKHQYNIAQFYMQPLEQAVVKASDILAAPQHRMVEQELADHAIVEIKNQGAYPLANKVKNILLSMPDTTKCMAFTLALKNRLSGANVNCLSLAHADKSANMTALKQADVVIAADISPDQSLAELGGMDDIVNWRQRAPKEQQITQQLALLQAAKAQQKTTIFVSLRTPYNTPQFAQYADAVLATFSYNLNKTEHMDDHGRMVIQYEGAIYNALADILTGRKTASGSLPVSVDWKN
ncbi:glycoside hydrolase family 3 N-terminal domain-containing protein [Paraglaciecola hydrolytica]|uniref:beta-N-acetylhexosaminidase n=1 Tax=Paraglaciecola hydrolytica TaxID=1799789 RepID=A0A136A4B3_9ALTE|nr:glycoside hydrolase family 3 protein [Paraglaciecola hydrolytica]KXI30057.1 glycosyl hydrolase family 3 [Paraglaciecola hydrolytica]